MRRLLPRDELNTRLPALALSVACVVLAILLYGLGYGLGAVVALFAAFLFVAAAKRG